MTKDQRDALTMAAKADAFDTISNLLLTLDSHRNIHRRVEQQVTTTQTICREIRNAPSTEAASFPCMCPQCDKDCGNLATEQVYCDEGSYLVCKLCANSLLNSGKFRTVVVEETVLQD